MKNKIKWYEKNFLLIPKISKEIEPKFLFKLYNFKKDGVIFLSTVLLIPLISLLFFRFFLGMGSGESKASIFTPSTDQETTYQLINFTITLLSAIAGFVYFAIKDARLFKKSGLISIYLFITLPSFVSFIPSSFFMGQEDWQTSIPGSITLIWSQITTEVIIIVFALLRTANLKERVVKTIKENWINVLIIVSCFALLILSLSLIWEEIIKGTVLEAETENQKSLTTNINNVYYAISIFIFSVIVAPFCEELIARNSFFTGTGNRVIALFTSALFFGMMHCQNSGDLQNIMSYLLPGMILSVIFNFTGGNMTYSWLTHATSNAIAFGLMFVK